MTNEVKFSAEQLKSELQEQYNMEANLYPLSQDVTFYGSEMECYKMGYKFKNKESEVRYSENLNTWYVSFPKWFDIDFAQIIG